MRSSARLFFIDVEFWILMGPAADTTFPKQAQEAAQNASFAVLPRPRDRWRWAESPGTG